MTQTVTVAVAPHAHGGARLLAPTGIATPYSALLAFDVAGADFRLIGETHTGQAAALIEAKAGRAVTLTYEFAESGPGYPEAMFAARTSRHTRPADQLVADAVRIAERAPDGHGAISAIVNDVAARFSYGHPEERFTDGFDHVPHVSCGVGEGSCVDINTYLIASLRSAGFEAGYVTGYFFPAEKNGTCDDGHCWVVTRHEGVVLEWDIAHHMKLGRLPVCCGLNPKPGSRVAVAHSMGLDFPAAGIAELKALIEPVWVDAEGGVEQAELTIGLRSTAVAAVA
jgi:transglutaminase-like putative cysteine protease